MLSNYQKSTAAEPAWNQLQLRHNRVVVEEAAEKVEIDAYDTATVRIVIVLLFLIIATALFAFLSLYHRVSI